MTVTWGAANARARGLATHLLAREVLLRAAGSRSWPEAVNSLSESGYPADLAAGGSTSADVDEVIGRVLALRLSLLGRWLGRGRVALSVIYEEGESHAIRRLLRGAVQGTSPAARLVGVMSTPGLTGRVLQRLAQAGSPAELARALVRLGHPAGRVLGDAATGANAGALWRMERALARLFAARAIQAARSGGREVRRFAALHPDLLNLQAILLRDEWDPEVTAAELFVPGGLIIDHAGFSALAGAEPDRRAPALRARLAGTPLAGVCPEGSTPAGLEGRVLRALLAWQRRERRRDPLGPGGVLELIERMRAEAYDLRLVWRAVALGAPGQLTAAQLVTPG